MKKSSKAFSLVEILVALIIVSLITAAMAPIITKKLSSSGITISGGGGGGGVPSAGACGMGQYFDMDEQVCKHCPEGHFCDGFNKLVCLAGTSTSADGTDKHPLNGQSQCKECADGYYALEASPTCLLNTAKNCAERSKIDNICTACNGEDLLVDGNCVKDVPVYTLLNSSGADITATSTKLVKGSTYWTIEIKASGTLSFSSVPANVMDVFTVGGGSGGLIDVSGCDPAVGGGGNYNIIKNLVVQTDTSYPITIGSGSSAVNCSSLHSSGGTTSAFGLFTYGGVYKSSHSICPFNETSCTMKYGETGTSSNQKANSGNGGASQKKGMSGVVILRGQLGAKNAKAETYPTYKFLNSTGSDTTTTHTTLHVTNEYWFVRLTTSGTINFTYLPTSNVDVFVVGGGAGGLTDVSGCDPNVGGGGNFNTVRNVIINTDIAYPVKIGAGGSAVACSSSNKTGGTSSIFGIYSNGGVYTGSHSTCPFGDASCEFKYGNQGSTNNQNKNTGNGGASQKGAMDGIVIIRGTRTPNNTSLNLPIYKFLNDSGGEATLEYSTLYTANDYWYLRFTSSGKVLFEYLPTNSVDVFVLGGGSGGLIDVSGCEPAVGGGGTYSTTLGAQLSSGMSYPITVGSGSSAVNCSSLHSNGYTSSGFGIYSRGGVYTASYATCPFGDTTCDFKYGNTGSTTNQNPNTGNGGASQKAGMSGIVMVRGKMKNTSDITDKLPTYRYTNSSNADIASSATTLSVTSTHWYLKFSQSGSLVFDSIKNSKIDVFAVGGGAGGMVDVSGCDPSVGGGGNFKVSNNVNVVAGTTYPIVIGAGGGAKNCSATRASGGQSSAFGASAAGGSGTTNRKVCLFNSTECTTTYGNSGTSSNQFQNSGNGGASQKAGMNGVVIIRGTL